MYTTEIQKILNLLYTDPLSRKLFKTRRKNFYALNNVHSPDLVAFFDGLDAAQLDFFASALVSKRLHAVADLLPASVRLLGESFRRLFLEFSESYLPSGVHKHHEDAIAFCEYALQNIDAELIQCILDYEKERIQNFIKPHPSLLCIYPLDPLQISKKILDGREIHGFTKKRTVLFWWRGKLRSIFYF